jgi:hypothetical protein
MTTYDVTNANTSATPDNDFLDQFHVSPDIHEPASRIALQQNL